MSVSNMDPLRRCLQMLMSLRAEHLAWISDTLLKAIQLAPASLKVDVRIFVTGGSITGSFDGESMSSGTESQKKDNISDLLAHSAVTLCEGRPDISTILREEAESTSGRMSVSGEYIFPHAAQRPGADYRVLQCVARRRLRPPCAKACGLASRGPRASCAGARASRCTSSPSATLRAARRAIADVVDVVDVVNRDTLLTLELAA